MKLEQSIIDRAKNTDIVEVIGRYIDLKKNGNEHGACCPFHKEKSPSFSVNSDKNFYYCFGCGASGDPIDFISNYEQVSFREAVGRVIGDSDIGDSQPVQRAARVEEKPEWMPITPVPADTKLKPRDIFNRKVDGK